MSQKTNKLTIENLPLEVRQAILCAIADLKTLQTVIQTSTCLCSAFIVARKYIITNVLGHYIGPEFMYDAAIAEMTSQMKDPFTDEDLTKFLPKYKGRDQCLFNSVFQGTMSQAFRLARFHDLVEFFITDFASTTLKHKEAETGIPQNRSLSRNERNRIGQSFYRFEIFYNIFRDKELYFHPYGMRAKDKVVPDDYEYYDFFVPWENEQLACIRDYLFRAITPAIEDVAMNVPSYTAMFASIDLYDTIQGYVEQGLRYVRRIMQAESTDERYSLIEVALNGEELLNESFEHAYTSLDIYDRTARRLAPDAEEKFPKPWYADFEGGPRAVWYWAHESLPNRILCGSLCQAPLRKWGYVMWDNSRLETLVDFSTPWESRDYRECLRERSVKKQEDREKYRNRARYWVSQKKLEPDYLFETY